MASHQDGIDASKDLKDRVDLPIKVRILELYNEGLSDQQIVERGFNKEQVLEILR